jgi:hypothetical protein
LNKFKKIYQTTYRNCDTISVHHPIMTVPFPYMQQMFSNLKSFKMYLLELIT